MIKGLVVAATKSGSGKTTIALGLMAALARRGLRVAPFKVGPDFIDPGHHTRITGTVSRNLDGWMLSKDYNRECFARHTTDADIAIVEGVMGLFDGYDGKTEAGSTAQMAKWLGLPVLLVVDAKSMARSAAALVRGFEGFDPDLSFAGVLFNNIGSERHLAYLREALEDNVTMPCLGGVIREASVAIPERHLGLVTQNEHTLSEQNISNLADLIEGHADLDHLLARLPDIGTTGDLLSPSSALTAPRIRIGVAMDTAFCFYYQDNLDILESYGAEIIRFSPITDNALPRDLDGLYFGGGYPELFAEQLARNTALRHEIRTRSEAGMPIYGECGGFMYLCRELRALDGQTYPMTGCFPFATAMFSRLKALGYREVTLKQDALPGPAGQRIRGHEFHYSEITDIPEDPKIETVYALGKRIGDHRTDEGYRTARTLGSYVHLHFGSQPDAAAHFVRACRDYQQERTL